MANKRILKKNINYICGALFAEAVAASLYNGAADKDNSRALMSSILRTHSDFLSRMSHPEPGMEQRKYYTRLSADFQKAVAELLDQVCNIN